MFDEAVDRERPRRGRELGRDLGGQHRPLVAGVVLTGREPRVARRTSTTREPSRELRHGRLLSVASISDLIIVGASMLGHLVERGRVHHQSSE